MMDEARETALKPPEILAPAGDITAALETAIDAAAYHLYGLTEEEIAVGDLKCRN